MSANAKELIFEEQSRELLAKGIKKAAEVVAFTLGPKGRTVALEKSWGAPSITNDGSAIAKEITFSDQYENMGAAMAKEVVQKIKEKCGDGTTTGLLLFNALVSCGLKQISSGTNPTLLKRGIDKAVEAIVKELDSKSIAIKSSAETRNIATVSASGNGQIGATIAEAVEKAGRDGVITIEEAKGTNTVIEKVEGLKFDRGYISAYFCTDADKMQVVLEDADILLIDRKVSSVHDILPTLQMAASSARALLIIAEDVESDALSTLVVNKLRGTLKVCAVKAPGFGDRRKAMMEDIAVMTGGTLICDDAGISSKDITPSMLGHAARIIVTKEHTTIVDGRGEPAQIQARIKQIDNEAAKTTSSYDKEKLEERKAKLSGGVAVIRVGAITEQEMKQLKSMYEDSLNSTKAALQEGIVPGGGVALLRARQQLATLGLSGDEALGAKIVFAACEAPFKQIVNNAGHDGAVALFEVEQKGGDWGFNALTEQVEELLKAGVIDPTKVVKNALLYASSAAGVVLLTEVLIGSAPEAEENGEEA